MSEHGGKRENAGKPKGTRSKKTLEKQAIAEKFNQRVMNVVDRLFNAQLTLAVGSMKVIRIDEEIIDGKTKRTHSLVTNEKEIIKFLDKWEGNAGEVENKYYYFSEILPDNKAIDSMLNRALGKPKDSLDVTSDGEKIDFTFRIQSNAPILDGLKDD